MNQTAKPPQPPLVVLWVLWAALQSGIVVLYTFLHAPATSSAFQSPAQLPWLLALVPVLVSAVIRWSILPRVKSAQNLLICMLVGMTLAEMSTILGIFLFTPNQQEIFILSALGIFQFVPFYAQRILAEASH